MGYLIARTNVTQRGYKSCNFIVSTINRGCSALGASDLIYAETIVWRADKNWNQLNIMHQDESCRDDVRKHLEIVRALYETGLPDPPKDGEF